MRRSTDVEHPLRDRGSRHEWFVELVDRKLLVMRFPAVDKVIEVLGGDGAALPQLVRPGRILVIDDEPEIVLLVKETLVAEGHTVETALCGSDGVSMAAAFALGAEGVQMGTRMVSALESPPATAPRLARWSVFPHYGRRNPPGKFPCPAGSGKETPAGFPPRHACPSTGP